MSVSVLNSYSVSTRQALSNSLSDAALAATKMATGEGIQHAYEDPTGLAIGSSMKGDLDVLKIVYTGIKQTQSMVYIAEEGMKAIHGTMSKLNQVLAKAKLGYMTDALVQSTLSPTYIQLKEEINRIADSIDFNGQKLLNGTGGKKTAATVSTLGSASPASISVNSGGNSVTTLAGFSANADILTGLIGDVSGFTIGSSVTTLAQFPANANIVTKGASYVAASAATPTSYNLSVGSASAMTVGTLTIPDFTLADLNNLDIFTNPLTSATNLSQVFTSTGITTSGNNITIAGNLAITGNFSDDGGVTTDPNKTFTIPVSITMTGASVSGGIASGNITAVNVAASAAITATGFSNVTPNATTVNAPKSIAISDTAVSVNNLTANVTGNVTFKAGAAAVTPVVTGGTYAYDANGDFVVTGATVALSTIKISNGASTGDGDLSVDGVTLKFKAGEFDYDASLNKISSKVGKSPVITAEGTYTWTPSGTPGTITSASTFTGTNVMGITSGATSSISNVTASTFSTGASITFKAGATAVTPTVTGGTTAYDANGNLVVTNATLGMNDIIISDGANQGNGDLSVTGVTLTFNKGEFDYDVANNKITSKPNKSPVVSNILPANVAWTKSATPGAISVLRGINGSGAIDIADGVGSSMDHLLGQGTVYTLSGGSTATSTFNFVTGSDLNEAIVEVDFPNLRLTANNGINGLIETINSSENIVNAVPLDLTNLQSISDADKDIPLVQVLADKLIEYIDELGAYQTRLMNIEAQLATSVAQVDLAQGAIMNADLADQTEVFTREGVKINVAIAVLGQMNASLKALERLVQ